MKKLKKLSVKKLSMIDGLMCVCVLFLLTDYSVSTYLNSMEFGMLISLLCSVILTVTYIVFLSNVHGKKQLIAFSGLSLLYFFLFGIILFLLHFMPVPIHLFPMREVNNADGLYIMLIWGTFIISLIPLRLITLIVFLLRKSTPNSIIY